MLKSSQKIENHSQESKKLSKISKHGTEKLLKYLSNIKKIHKQLKTVVARRCGGENRPN